MTNTATLSRKPEVLCFLDRTIKHPIFNDAIEAIRLVHSTYGCQPTGMMLNGPSGVGKSTLLEYYRKQHGLSSLAHPEVPGSDLNVLLVRTPAAATTKQVLAEMVEALGGDCGGRPTENELHRMVRRLLKARATTLIILDEFQHLSRDESGRSPRQAANTIKNIMSETAIPFVLAGLEHSENVLYNHEELKRRFSATFKLMPLGISSTEQLEYFVRYLWSCQEALGVPSIQLATTEMAYRFYTASKGTLGPITRILELAMQHADLSASMTMEDLAMGFDRFRLRPEPEELNPFRATPQQLKRALGMSK